MTACNVPSTALQTTWDGVGLAPRLGPGRECWQWFTAAPCAELVARLLHPPGIRTASALRSSASCAAVQWLQPALPPGIAHPPCVLRSCRTCCATRRASRSHCLQSQFRKTGLSVPLSTGGSPVWARQRPTEALWAVWLRGVAGAWLASQIHSHLPARLKRTWAQRAPHSAAR